MSESVEMKEINWQTNISCHENTWSAKCQEKSTKLAFLLFLALPLIPNQFLIEESLYLLYFVTLS